MILIAEKINGSIPSCAAAIKAGDESYIKDLAKRQAEAGVDFIDCCASVRINELETISWMIEAIQSVTDCPISLDSPDVSVLVDAMSLCKRPGMFNSVSGEGDKLDIAFPLLAKPENKDWQIMALLCDDKGIPKSADKRIEVFHMIMSKADHYGIDEKRIYIDPLVEMLCTADDGEGIHLVFDVIKQIKKSHPSVHISGAISNVSFNLPVRRIVNQAFTALAINAGMDCAVLDPLNNDLRGIILAAEAMLGLDDLCVEYVTAYREGIIS